MMYAHFAMLEHFKGFKVELYAAQIFNYFSVKNNSTPECGFLETSATYYYFLMIIKIRQLEQLHL